MFRLALVSREVYPFGGGGLGAYVTATADALAEIAEVTILTRDVYEAQYERLRVASSPLLPHRDVRFAFVPDVGDDEVGSYFNQTHRWSARVLAKLKELYPQHGPEVIEFPDYLGEGALTVQARQTRDPYLRNSLVCVRLYTSSEMTSVLNGFVLRDPSSRLHFDLERYALAHADRILWPGGDVHGTYARFYDNRLAPASLVRHAVLPMSPATSDDDSDPSELRLAYVGRLERRKGVQDLIRAATSLERTDWRLTLVGADTDTGPLGTSMRKQLELAVAGDARIVFDQALSRAEVLELVGDHDVLVMPSRWECWPNTVLEALGCNRPVLATPVGGHIELVQPGESGWLTDEPGPAALARALNELPERREELSKLKNGLVKRRFAELTNLDEIRNCYSDLAEEPARRAPKPGSMEQPLVTVVVPYFALHRYVEETVRSIFEQTYREVEVLVVNDGSFGREDWVLGELSARYPITVLTQQNSGLGAARNFGIGQSRGRYVFPLDADNVATPSFIERCVEVLQERPELMYVNSWVRYIDEQSKPHRPPIEGYQPVSNELSALDVLNVAGDAAAVIRRRAFDLGFWYSEDATSYEDWLLYRELAKAGFYGHSIPERLLLYRVREGSMLRDVAHQHHERLTGELDAHERERDMQWMS
jgi:glycosyltransferase involved in cell wall biosynthesis